MVRLDAIKLTNPIDGLKVDDVMEEHDSNNEDNDDEEYDDEEDGFGRRGPFDYDYDDEDDGYVCRDPFEHVIEFDSYFQVYLESHPSMSVNLEENEESMPPAAENHPCVEEYSNPPPHSQGNSAPADENTPIQKGTKRRRGRPQEKKIVSSDARSTIVHVMQDFKVGEIVKFKVELINRARVQSVKANREFKVTHLDPKRFVVTCADKNCKWRLRGTLSKSHCGWVIHSYEKHHSCSIYLRQKVKRGAATAETIAHMIKNDENDTIRMQEMLESKYGMKVSYWKAWKARQIGNHIVRGTPESSLLGLPSYLWLLEEANPETYTAYQLDKNNCFEAWFLALGSSIGGFRTCIRPVIAVDESHLKGRYKGKLYGNNQIYPLAFCVAATENDHIWSWFFEKFHHVIGARDDLVFIFYRHPSIEKCCLKEFPDAVYGICMFHLGLNMAARYKVKAKEFLYGVAKAYTEIDFKEMIHQVQATKKNVYDYLIDANPKKWDRCYFSARRYSIMTTNIPESMIALLKEACEFPILEMLEIIRTKLQGWFHDRLQLAKQWTSTLTPYAERKLSKRDDKSRHFKIYPIDQWRFYMLDGQDNATVDINLQTCTCMKFQLNQLPCSHAIRDSKERGLSIYTVASSLYTLECLRMAYAILVNQYNIEVNGASHSS
ncbi:hypothetical protein LIER_28735 [Lithospermum erythrorhizon]|uniref:SWIM-type domain-containing protein n=1 Tax=Lithospermum erythrorhizon TaxID=34254 RepID=A0AAV3RL06_LITER